MLGCMSIAGLILIVIYLAATMIPLPGSDCTLADLIDEWTGDDGACADDDEGNES